MANESAANGAMITAPATAPTVATERQSVRDGAAHRGLLTSPIGSSSARHECRRHQDNP
ncbi:MAG: hypothetical protein U0531_17030 [Dehalococcoidia bacterium]